MPPLRSSHLWILYTGWATVVILKMMCPIFSAYMAKNDKNRQKSPKSYTAEYDWLYSQLFRIELNINSTLFQHGFEYCFNNNFKMVSKWFHKWVRFECKASLQRCQLAFSMISKLCQVELKLSSNRIKHNVKLNSNWILNDVKLS